MESVLADMDDAREHEEAVRAMIEGSLSAEDDEVCEAELAALEAPEATEANETEPSEATTTRVAGTSGAVPTMPDVPEKAPTSRTRPWDWAPREPSRRRGGGGGGGGGEEALAA